MVGDKDKRKRGRKRKRSVIPKLGPVRRAQALRNDAGKIVVAAEAATKSFDELIQATQWQFGRGKHQGKQQEGRACTYFNWRGCSKPAAECLKDGYTHVANLEAYSRALQFAKRQEKGFRPNMPIKRHIAEFRRKALERSQGADESTMDESGMTQLNEASELDSGDDSERTEDDEEYDPAYGGHNADEPVTISVKQERKEPSQAGGAFTAGTSTTSPSRIRTTSQATPSKEQALATDMKGIPEHVAQDKMAMKFVKPTIEEMTSDFLKMQNEKHKPEIDKLNEEKSKIVKEYVDTGDYGGINKDGNIKRIDQKCQEIQEKIEKEVKEFKEKKIKEEKEKEMRCFGAMEFESTRGLDKERGPFKHRYSVVKPTSLGPLHYKNYQGQQQRIGAALRELL